MAIVAAWGIMRTTLVSSPRIPAAATLAADAPPVTFGLVDQRYASFGAVVPPAVDAALGAAFVNEPLAGDPFLYRARQRVEAGDRAGAIGLLEEARRRSPRSRPVRMMLIEQYLRAENIAAATVEIGVLSKLTPVARDHLSRAVSQLMLDKEVRPAVVRALAADPIYDSILAELARTGADADLIVDLARQQVQSDQPREGRGIWRIALIDRLVDERQYRKARQLWGTFFNVPDDAGGNAVYDGRFAGRPGSRPFNWQLTTNQTGAAERSRRGGLDVDYFGRTSGPLARQLLLLSPGQYRLTFRADGNANAQGSRLVWQVMCDGASSTLSETVLDRVEAAPRAFAANFTVPAQNCVAQWLSLEGMAAEFPTTQSAHIDNVEIRSSGSAR
ncbi:hypothetical protein [Allosphingosinicella indica]|uniref:hypothetical protein n=1 Tax=Allosphingosinicella indica TaxID=941907 RepID=UPI0012F4D740|nr:hypothetical protein [Allosphingosinicella indica]